MISLKEIEDICRNFSKEKKVKIKLTQRIPYISMYYPEYDTIAINHVKIQMRFNDILKKKPNYDWKPKLFESLNHELFHRTIYLKNRMELYGIFNDILSGVEDYFIDVIMNNSPNNIRNLYEEFIEYKDWFIDAIKLGYIMPIFGATMILSPDEIVKYIPAPYSSILLTLKNILNKMSDIDTIPPAYYNSRNLLLNIDTWKFGRQLKRGHPA